MPNFLTKSFERREEAKASFYVLPLQQCIVGENYYVEKTWIKEGLICLVRKTRKLSWKVSGMYNIHSF